MGRRPNSVVDEVIDDEVSNLNENESTISKDEPIEVGMKSESKDLYREDYRQPWEEWAPDDIGINSKSTPESAKFALIVRREKRNGDTEEPVLALHSISVQSPLIKELLGPVFAGYRGINTNLKKLEFHAPFHEFFYRWEGFIKAEPHGDEDNDIARKHYKLLFNIISPEITAHIEQRNDLIKNGVISFDYVWTLFEPGTEIYSRVDDQDRLFLLDGGKYQKLPNDALIYNLSCRYIDTNGEIFGYTTTSLAIGQFENLKPVFELNVLPSHLQPNMGEIRARLEERGERFQALKGIHYKQYSGVYTLRKAPVGASRRQFVEDGRIVIDCNSFMRYNGDSSSQLLPLNNPDQGSVHLDASGPTFGFGDADSDSDSDLLMPPAIQFLRRLANRANRKFAASGKSSEATSLCKEHLAFCTPLLKGFCLKAKTWVYFYIDSVKEIIWNEDSFNQLVLPQDYKQIVLAFVHAQLSHRDDFDDVIKGKGRGIIMLLSGEPGTGKTLTSESVAEEMKRPLYAMSAGELGDDADEMERSLQRVLELSTKWGAVLLIDECDVFLERRSLHDLHRNKLVSVFLRLLEYYQGVMFLTTNRVEDFDPAFESRIHLTINYPKLDHQSRLHIWKTFVTRGAGDRSSIAAEDLAELAKEDLNGRQIKNVVKTARLLASRDGAPLGLEHVETVLRVKHGGPARISS
ncbi:hypothetical protein J7T55_001521 [Diaporthe amygdali]|uniref:uncharacterized protein n=1 Tax=Phomopsis amygdali TaxID=1214568 RepID=UPI0022FEB3F2|nr:uncharacterized protein J7T55_001521 [Diaporthe amygdali]KAJ0115112.1 hypothetical protein J7T55_001521 [Diaporthe amygdali]